MPDEVRQAFYPEAGAIVFERVGRLLLVRYNDEPHVWSAPRQRIGFGSEPEHDAIMAALNHACAEVEEMGDPWWSDYRVPEQGIHRIVVWYECFFWRSAINLPRPHVLEYAWVHPRTVPLHPLMIPTEGQLVPQSFKSVAEHVGATTM